VSPEHIQAAGILGNVRLVPDLIRTLQLDDVQAKAAAAEALSLITGAALTENIQTIEETDLLDGEVEERKREVKTVSRSFGRWLDWWRQNGVRFDANRRWRRGRTFSPGVCIEELKDGMTTFPARQRAYWELVIHSRTDHRLELDWFVPRQKQALARWESWWQSRSNPDVS
jgi:hypothetical protein